MAEELYIPRMGTPNVNVGSDIQQMFGGLTDSIRHMQASRAINSAQQQVQDITANETSEAKQNQARVQIGNSLGQQLVGLGYPADGVKGASPIAQAFMPPKPILPQDEVNLTYQAQKDPVARQALTELLKNRQEVFANNQQAKASAKADNAPDDEDSDKILKRQLKTNQAFLQFGKTLEIDDKSKGPLGLAQTNVQRAQSLMALLGPNTSVQALDQQSRQFVFEAAASLASQVKSGQVTEAELHNFVPETFAMTKARAASWLQNQPMPANAGKFLELYGHTAQREYAINSQTIAESLLNRAQQGVQLHSVNPDQYKTAVASALRTAANKAVGKDDILVEGGKVTTKEQQAMDDKFKTVSDKLGPAKMLANSKDPEQAAKAQSFLKSWGFDQSGSLPEMKARLKYLIRSGNAGITNQ